MPLHDVQGGRDPEKGRKGDGKRRNWAGPYTESVELEGLVGAEDDLETLGGRDEGGLRRFLFAAEAAERRPRLAVAAALVEELHRIGAALGRVLQIETLHERRRHHVARIGADLPHALLESNCRFIGFFFQKIFSSAFAISLSLRVEVFWFLYLMVLFLLQSLTTGNDPKRLETSGLTDSVPLELSQSTWGNEPKRLGTTRWKQQHKWVGPTSSNERVNWGVTTP